MQRRANFLSYALLLSIGGLVLVGSLLLQQPALNTTLGGLPLAAALLHAGRATLTSCAFVALVSAVLGVGLGMLHWWEGGPVRALVQGLTDLATSLPTLVMVALLMAGAWGSPFGGFVAGLGTLRALEIAHELSATLNRLRPAHVAGDASSHRLPFWVFVRRYVLPQAIVPILTSIGLCFPAVVGLEASFAFLGLPGASAWNLGRMLIADEPLARGWALVFVTFTAGALFLVLRSISQGDGLNGARSSRRPGLAAPAETSKSKT